MPAFTSHFKATVIIKEQEQSDYSNSFKAFHVSVDLFQTQQHRDRKEVKD